jgi:4-hydroxy-tetrahydrodipicolinate reductase
MKVLLIGTGRMGCALEKVLADSGHEVVARVGRTGDERGRTIADALAATQPEAALEFTTPASACANVLAAIRRGIPIVSGTTGWDTAPAVQLADQSGVPVLIASNFSIGIAVLQSIVAAAAHRLQPFADFEPGIIERHHRAKKDAPSGTAKSIRERIVAAGRWSQVPTVSLRQGGQPGEHTVYFEGAGECLTITHQVRDRSVFAVGAVRAAEWLVRERPRGFVTFDTFLERTELCLAH